MPDFQQSSEGIELDGSILKARLIDLEGELQDRELDLNNLLGNNDGSFEWGGSGFNDTAEDVQLSFEGDNLPILRARLQNVEGEWVDADVNLAERVGNVGGEFVFDE